MHAADGASDNEHGDSMTMTSYCASGIHAPSIDILRNIGKVKKKRGRRVLMELALDASLTTVLLLFYCIIGAWVVAAIEAPLESPRETKRQLSEAFIRNLLNASSLPICAANGNGSQSDAPINVTMATSQRRSPPCVDLESLDRLVNIYANQTLNKVVEMGVTSREPIWTFVGATYYCWTLALSVGYGNYYPASYYGKVFTMSYALLGMPLLVLNATELGLVFTISITQLKITVVRAYTSRWRRHKLEKNRKNTRQRRQGDRALLLDNPTIRIQKLNEKLVELMKQRHHHPVVQSERRIPLWIVVFVFPLYIALVGTYFFITEPLSFFDSYYFAFITFTSIGFGDIVPTNELGFLLFSFFIFLGFGLCAGVVECMQEWLLRFSQKAKKYIVREFGPGGDKED